MGNKKTVPSCYMTEENMITAEDGVRLLQSLGRWPKDWKPKYGWDNFNKTGSDAPPKEED